MAKKLGVILKLVLFLGLGFFFIWLFIRKLTPGQVHDIFESLGHANYYWLLLALLLGILSHVVRSLRWNLLLAPLGYKPGIKNTFFAVMIGYFANLALPRLGEVTRCTILAKYEKVNFSTSFGTVIVERALDFLVFLLLFFVNLFMQFGLLHQYVSEKIYAPLAEKFSFFSDSRNLFYSLLGIAILGILFFTVFRKRIRHAGIYLKIRGILAGFWQGLWSLGKLKNPCLFIFYTLAIWTLYFFMTYVCFFSLDGSSSMGPDAGLAILIFGSVGIMVVQGGIGVYPAIVAETASLYAVARTTGYALGWLAWTTQTLMIVLAGAAAMILLPLLNKTNHEPS